ncbi:MAG: hypothetical protein EOO26_03300 [Comamonadaceae bacterium]|nr:MAG: hypothetical protein EOO26_03300 [Comamonadaceae bacterium]
MRITTGTGGAPDQGDIVMDDAQIVYNVAGGTRTLTLDAHRSVRSNGGTTIASYGDGGPLNVVFNANANNTSPPPDGGQVSYSGNIYTNGGNVAMSGSWGNATNLGVSIALDGEVIDTRGGNQLGTGPGGYSGGKNELAGGSVQLNGRSNFPPLPDGSVPNDQAGGVFISGTNVRTSTGDVNVFGSSTFGNGVVIDAVAGQGGIFTTSGNVLITGVGSYVSSSPYGSGHGVVIGNGNIAFTAGPTLSSENGNIALRGVRLAGGPISGNGVQLGQRSLVTTTGSGNIEITGESQGNGAGVNFSPELTGTFPTVPAANVAGNNNVVLRAANDGSTDALVVGTGSKVSAASVLNLRPGGLDVQGGATNYAATAVDRTGNAVTLGGPTGAGFSVSSAELARMTAPTLVVGSNAHAANITVAGAIATAGALTLQNGAGGGIQLNAPVTAQRLGLISNGDITQAAGAPITAGTLLARSTAGNVLLENPANNVSASTLGGSAAGAFRYVDADTVQLGSVSVTAFDAGGNVPYVESATSMAADTVFVRTLTGDLLLGTNVTSGGGTDLVAGARFQNLGSYGIAGAPWRVWADTWVGETRGGLTGSAPLPNFYNCAFAGFCGVTLTPGNHFIYRQQPDATVVVGNQTRPFGVPNLPFTFSVAGLILGDTGAGFSGTFSSAGTSLSLPGRYPINATFTSAEGYRVTVLPGELFVTAAFNRPLPDVLREIPQTWLYDRNIGQAPICLATGPLDGDRSSQGNDVLAREWSRVRSRPNLLSCVDTERRNGCADF